MKTNTSGTALAASIILTGLVPASLQGALAVHEPFADSDSTLPGNATGSGLTGNWAGASSAIVSNMSYGSLETSGNAVQAVSGWKNNQATVDPTNTAYTSLLADGGEMWFSMVFRIDSLASNNGAYSRFGFGIGDAGFTSNGDLSGDTSSQAIGFGLATNRRLYAGLWETNNWGANNMQGAPASADGTTPSFGSLTDTQTVFIVGRVNWGDIDATDDDVVTLFLPTETELANGQTGTAVASSSGITSQSSFNLIATHNGNNITSTFDEIRIGGSYADVAPVPEPSSTALLGLAGFALILRRRK